MTDALSSIGTIGGDAYVRAVAPVGASAAHNNNTASNAGADRNTGVHGAGAVGVSLQAGQPSAVQNSTGGNTGGNNGSVSAIDGATDNAAVSVQAVSSDTQQNGTNQNNTNTVQPLSPVVRQDGLSGVLVTQYFSGDGQVESQIPSDAVLNYLRQGLTATGEKKVDVATA